MAVQYQCEFCSEHVEERSLVAIRYSGQLLCNECINSLVDQLANQIACLSHEISDLEGRIEELEADLDGFIYGGP